MYLYGYYIIINQNNNRSELGITLLRRLKLVLNDQTYNTICIKHIISLCPFRKITIIINTKRYKTYNYVPTYKASKTVKGLVYELTRFTLRTGRYRYCYSPPQLPQYITHIIQFRFQILHFKNY